VSKTVVLGLSGGVDSLVSALLLKKNGYKIIACTFKLWKNEESVNSARLLAKSLNIEFRVLDISTTFKDKIVDPFIAEYIGGKTPNPCVWCNNDIKVYFLYQEMLNLKADFFATGHYVQIKDFHNKSYIYKGTDLPKDQSYFLWNVRAKYLKYWLTPLGNLTKIEVKQIAIDHKMGFLAHKKESMGVCFIGKQGYQSFISENLPKNKKIEEGEIVDENEVVIGKHNGTAFYTIGQKKGLNLKNKKRTVVKIDASINRLVVGYDTELFVKQFWVMDYYFIDEKDMSNSRLNVMVRGIGRNPKGFCLVGNIDNYLNVKLEGKAWAIATGQPVAFYVDDRLVGGGYIK